MKDKIIHTLKFIKTNSVVILTGFLLLLLYLLFSIESDLESIRLFRSAKNDVDKVIKPFYQSFYYKFAAVSFIVSAGVFIPNYKWSNIFGVPIYIFTKLSKSNSVAFEYLFFSQSVLLITRVVYPPLILGLIAGFISYIYLFAALATVTIPKDIPHPVKTAKVLRIFIYVTYHILALAIVK